MASIGKRPRVLCAPNAFKGTLTAGEAARAMARGVRRAGAEAIELPVADGGDGTAEVLGGRRVRLVASGPFGERWPVEYRVRPGGEAVIEVAQVGLARTARRDPIRARSDGVGEMIRHAVGHGARRIIVALGGSATVDGGVGLARALGVALVGTPDRPRAFTACGLPASLREIRIEAACDVRTRLGDAARLFAPQKGASPAQVVRLTRRLRALAALADPRFARLPGSGAAGGLGWALAALFGARLRSGAQLVLAEIGLESALEGADFVLTGEGKWDATTKEGKAPWAVVQAARRAGLPARAICGQVEGRSRVAVRMASGIEPSARLLEMTAAGVVAAWLGKNSPLFRTPRTD